MKRAISLMMCMTIIFSMSVINNETTSASQRSNMKKVLKYFKAKKYKKAKKYAKKLPKYANEKCVKKIPSKMKKAYNAKFNKLGNKAEASFFTDVNNDKKADMLVLYGTCEADLQIRLYTFYNGKVVYKAKTGGGHSAYNAYPNHKGFIRHYAHMGYESLSVIKYKQGKLVEKVIGSRDCGAKPYLNLGCMLKTQRSKY